MLIKTALTSSFLLLSASALAQPNLCNSLPSQQELDAALKSSVKTTNAAVTNGGLDFDMWATIVANDGTVCAVARTGTGINSQWLGSRVISAQKANTANAFSLDHGLALSTANLFSAVQPGGSLFGLQHSNPVNINVAYDGNSKNFGSPNDPLVGNRVGGVNVFGGGLALYAPGGALLGALGVSGDTSCADHNVAWRTRDHLGLDNVPAGLTTGDNIIYDIDANGDSTSGFGHPTCLATEHVVNEEILIEHPLP